MRLLRVAGPKSGAIVPHAPLLLPEVLADPPASVEKVTAALAELAFPNVDALVILSPHGSETGVYRAPAGSLDAFGVPGVVVSHPTDADFIADLAASWDEPVLDAAADHGVIVPLAMLDPRVPVVAASLPEVTGPAGSPPQDAIDAGRRFAIALGKATGGRAVAFVASAHTSAALSARAPLTDRPEGHELDDAICTALDRDCAELASIPATPWVAGGSCGAGPLNAFARLFAGRRAELFAYEASVGVGYLVARVEA